VRRRIKRLYQFKAFLPCSHYLPLLSLLRKYSNHDISNTQSSVSAEDYPDDSVLYDHQHYYGDGKVSAVIQPNNEHL